MRTMTSTFRDKDLNLLQEFLYKATQDQLCSRSLQRHCLQNYQA